MITIPLTTEDLTKVRLAPSPLWETVTSFEGRLGHPKGPARSTGLEPSVHPLFTQVPRRRGVLRSWHEA
jgi:hypothetical protein